ncbi:hypothetical protein C4D60_Mb02t14640 [Musa balbisiana]|uniref:Malectin-like domain-containing protein n=1 Tax=Musa balbisiana TaxID=52838 RepID=A0A4S8IAV7_MUSBA|nr:hypothetical protein C4D60_Mb02t14640 [Musa balbisiana]
MERERGVEVAGRAQRGVSSWRGRERREAAGMLLPCAVRRPLLRCIILSAISLWIPAAARNKGTLLDSGRPFLFLGLAKIKKLSFPIWTSKASILFLLSLAFPLRSPAEPYAMRISCGARDDISTKPTNTLWYRDFGYTGGKFANATVPSFIEPPLKTLRYFPLSDGLQNCYKINNVPRGHYQVRLFFALIADPSFDSEPTFDISIDGTQIYSLKSGWSNIDEQSFVEAYVFVIDRSFTTCFHSTGHGDPSILSIEILQIDDNAYYFGPLWGKGTVLRTAKRMTCGSGKSAFDEDYGGNHWGGDRFWLGVSSFPDSGQPTSTEHNISQTSILPNFYPENLYQSAIVGDDDQPDLSFQMEVDPNKKYSVWFHLSEIDSKITGEGQRVFDILLNGDIAFENVDIIRKTGGSYAALVLNSTIEASGRTLTITFRTKPGSHAIINAIEGPLLQPTQWINSSEPWPADEIANTVGLTRILMAIYYLEEFQQTLEDGHFTGLASSNAGLCGIPGLPTCGPHLSVAVKIGIAFGALFALLLVVLCVLIWWKRRENILRARKIAAAREAPYAKARTQFGRDVQMTKHYRPHEARNNAESGSNLLS